MTSASAFDKGAFKLPPAGGFSLFGSDVELETSRTLDARSLRRKPTKRELRKALGREALAEFMPTLPDPGVSVHIIANGRYDFWQWIPHILELLQEPAELYGSTWTMNRGNALELLDLLDAGKLSGATLLTGLYFKRRETAVYATLVQGLQERGQTYTALANHAKVIGLGEIVVEGSANFTANPRLEQYILTRDEELAAFHRDWMLEAVGRGE